MKIRPEYELAAINILSIILIVVIATSSSDTLRIIIGLPLIIFFPGYVLVAALFPKKTDLDGIERIALSFGLSIAITPLIGLILNFYTSSGIKLYPVLISLTMFVLITSIIARFRFKGLSEKYSSIEFNINLSQWTILSRGEKALSIMLLVAILGTIGTIAYVMINPRTGEQFTQFYAFGTEGNTTNYPSELIVGEEGKVLLGIANHEHEDNLAYQVDILIDNYKEKTLNTPELDHNEIWEDEVGFIPQKPGDDQKVEFILYKNGAEKPYRSLYLFIDVSDNNSDLVY